jgi:F-type H+-transporting ATPase subunit epsilon
MVAGDTLTLRVITPEEIVLDVPASAVRIPGVDGSIGILPRHAAMVAALSTGMLRYRQAGEERYLFVSDGFAEVRDNTLRLVCEAGDPAEEIDEQRARAAEKRARERLALVRAGGPAADQIDILRAEASLRRALARLHVLGYADREQRVL